MGALRGVVGLLVAGAVVAAGPAVAGDRLDRAVRGASSLLAPAYDASAGADLRALGIALQSYALVEGDLTAVTAQELVEWGWTDSGTTTVTVWVDGDRFLAHARDVRPGASTLQVSSDHLAVRALPAGGGVPDGADGDLPVRFDVVRADLPSQ